MVLFIKDQLYKYASINIQFLRNYIVKIRSQAVINTASLIVKKITSLYSLKRRFYINKKAAREVLAALCCRHDDCYLKTVIVALRQPAAASLDFGK